MAEEVKIAKELIDQLPKKPKKDNWVKCRAFIMDDQGIPGGKTVRVNCQKYHKRGQKCGTHSIDGQSWRDGDVRPRAYRQAALWLTNGNRIVKPGAGEGCSMPYDQIIIAEEDLQNGVKYETFIANLERAKLARVHKDEHSPSIYDVQMKPGNYSFMANALNHEGVMYDMVHFHFTDKQKMIEAMEKIVNGECPLEESKSQREAREAEEKASLGVICPHNNEPCKRNCYTHLDQCPYKTCPLPSNPLVKENAEKK